MQNNTKIEMKKTATGGSILEKRVNPDLLEERSKCNFD